MTDTTFEIAVALENIGELLAVEIEALASKKDALAGELGKICADISILVYDILEHDDKLSKHADNVLKNLTPLTCGQLSRLSLKSNKQLTYKIVGDRLSELIGILKRT